MHHNYLSNTERVAALSEREQKSITAFKMFCGKRRWKCSHSTPKEDMESHIDFWVNIGGQKVAFELKGEKEGDETLILVEHRNVQGNLGWLYGKAKYIAFQRGRDFLIVEREKLKEIAAIDGERGDKLCLAPKWYARHDRPNERVTWLPLNKVEEIKASV